MHSRFIAWCLTHNKALVRTLITLRFIHAAQLGRYIARALTALNKLGICIAMDDFGVGYSSLSYLRQYPFDVLKIDRSFIRDITEDVKDRELISAAIAMAHSLKIKVVAEGIETQEQLAYLKQLGGDYGQGYFFSKPVTVEEITKLLKKQSYG